MELTYYTVYSLSLIFMLCDGSVISFTSSKAVITTPLTRTLKMDCALFDTDSSPTAGSGGLVGRDVTSTGSDVSFVTSIVLMRNNVETIASVTQLDPVQWPSSISNLVVKGNVSRAEQGVKGYLELMWDYPNSANAGNYTCEINAISSDGHNVVFSKSLEIKQSTATPNDVINNVADLHKQMDQLMAMLTSSATHSEQGTLECGDSNSWTRPTVYSHSNERETMMNQTFTKAYASLPIVHLGVTQFDGKTDNSRYNYGSYFQVDLVNVDQQGFSIRCSTVDYSTRGITNLTVSWFSGK